MSEFVSIMSMRKQSCTQLSVSGLVVKAEESNNFHLYTITDMSGPALEVRNFVDTEVRSEWMGDWMDG